MRFRYSLVPLLLLSVAGTASGQTGNSECSSFPNQAQNVCNAAIDGTRLFHPLAGLLVSGGNPVIGTAQTLGGLPHFFLSARVNGVGVRPPNLNFDGSSNTVATDDKVIFPAPLIEGGLGVWKGLNGGLLSVDALGSAQLLPTTQVDNLTVDPDARKIGSIALGLGYGARVGIIRGNFPLPSVSVSVMRRSIPRLQYGDITDLSQDYQYAVDLDATNLRAVASMRLLILNVAVGLGWDKYTGGATVIFRDPITQLPHAPIDIDLDNTRTMAFADAVIDLPIFKIAGEIGYQGGKDQHLTTNFDSVDTTKGHFFGGAGIRITF
ncbi:MAG: hypothetical protein ABI679_10845 [Gemmatimonadota bacterium]